jgi:hypothetical protein
MRSHHEQGSSLGSCASLWCFRSSILDSFSNSLSIDEMSKLCMAFDNDLRYIEAWHLSGEMDQGHDNAEISSVQDRNDFHSLQDMTIEILW